MTQYDPYNPPASGQTPEPWRQDAPLGPSPSVQATMNQMTDRMQTVIDAAERAADAIRLDAEEQARRHLAEAQQKADRMTAERVRLISELTDDLIRHAATVRDHSEQMVRALEDAISSVTGKLGEPAFTDSFQLDQGSSSYDAPSLPIGSPTAEPAAPPVPEPAPEPPGYETPSYEPPRYEAEARYESSWPEATPAAPAPEAAPQPPVTPEPPTPAPPGPSAGPAAVPQEALLHATRLAVAGSDRDEIARVLRDEHGIADPDPVVDRVLGEG